MRLAIVEIHAVRYTFMNDNPIDMKHLVSSYQAGSAGA